MNSKVNWILKFPSRGFRFSSYLPIDITHAILNLSSIKLRAQHHFLLHKSEL